MIKEHHRINRSGWLRAAVLGANDGIVSTASLIVGVAAAQSSREAVMVAGIAGLLLMLMHLGALVDDPRQVNEAVTHKFPPLNPGGNNTVTFCVP